MRVCVYACMYVYIAVVDIELTTWRVHDGPFATWITRYDLKTRVQVRKWNRIWGAVNETTRTHTQSMTFYFTRVPGGNTKTVRKNAVGTDGRYVRARARLSDALFIDVCGRTQICFRRPNSGAYYVRRPPCSFSCYAFVIRGRRRPAAAAAAASGVPLYLPPTKGENPLSRVRDDSVGRIVARRVASPPPTGNGRRPDGIDDNKKK